MVANPTTHSPEPRMDVHENAPTMHHHVHDTHERSADDCAGLASRSYLLLIVQCSALGGEFYFAG